jgi:hypothetical protein
MPHIFFLGNYLFRVYEIHTQNNWMFPLHMLFFHIISMYVYSLMPAWNKDMHAFPVPARFLFATQHTGFQALIIQYVFLVILLTVVFRCTNFSNLFWNRTLHVLDSFSVHHQESSTVHTATGICHTGYADCWSSILIPLASSQHNLYDIYLLLCVQCWTPDDGQRNCPKHVEFCSKINLRH